MFMFSFIFYILLVIRGTGECKSNVSDKGMAAIVREILVYLQARVVRSECFQSNFAYGSFSPMSSNF